MVKRRSTATCACRAVDTEFSFPNCHLCGGGFLGGGQNMPENTILKYFKYDHLPEHLQKHSKPFSDLAHDVADKIAKYLYDKAKENYDSRKGKQTKEVMKEVDSSNGHGIITHLDFRGNRILLPEVATKLSKLDETQEVCISAKKDEIVIKKFS